MNVECEAGMEHLLEMVNLCASLECHVCIQSIMSYVNQDRL